MMYHSWCGVSLRSGSMYIAAGFGLFSAVMLTLLAVRLDAVSEALALRAAELAAMHPHRHHRLATDPSAPDSNWNSSDWNWNWTSSSPPLSPSPSPSLSPTTWDSFSNWTWNPNSTTDSPTEETPRAPPGPAPTKPDGKMQSLHAVQGVVAAATAFYAAQAVVNGLLLLGASQENERLVYPWIAVYSFVVVINMIVVAVVPAAFFNHGFSVDGIFAVLGSILYLVVTFYALGIVYSFCKQIRRIHTCVG